MAFWWQEGVIYQIYPRSFMDASGDGVGDLEGIKQRLDYLAWLGVDAIWFSPIFPSPMADFGYDVADYTDIHADYGTLGDFDRLLVTAHSKRIKVLLDLVPNHTSSAHPWFQEALQGRDSAKRDWYIWKDPGPDGGPPNNWMSYFGGPAWTFDETSGQYYMHNFDPGQPELNWRNPEVKEAIFNAIRFWLARGVDGFRIDVIDRLLKDPEFRDNPLDDPANPMSQRRIYSEQAPGTHDLMREFRRVFDEFPGAVAIGELAYDLSPAAIAAYYGDEAEPTLGDELHLPFNFGLIMQKWDADAIRNYISEYDRAVPPYGWPNYVLGNHDRARLVSRIGEGQARVAAMLMLTLRGTPTLYYGDELGMANVPVPLEQMQDPQGKVGFNRDECRTPMPWDASEKGGFTTGDPWLPITPNLDAVNVEAQRDNPDSMLTLYRQLLTYRRRTPALRLGRYYPVEAAPAGCFAYIRQFNDQRRLIALNFTDAPLELDLEDEGTIALSTHPDRDTATVTTLTLNPDEGLIVEL
jgi:alpha-glucosidase